MNGYPKHSDCVVECDSGEGMYEYNLKGNKIMNYAYRYTNTTILIYTLQVVSQEQWKEFEVYNVSTAEVFVSYNAVQYNVLHFNLFPLLRDCSTVAHPTYAVAMSLYQIVF